MLSENFANNKYLVMRNSVPTEIIASLSEYLWLRKKFNLLGKESEVNADMISREPILDVVLDFFTDSVSRIVGKPLIPTYSFSRLYYRGAVLPRHVDRPPCEISCTIPLDYSGQSGWAFFTSLFREGDNGEKIDLVKGDMLIYKGEEVYHWREPLTEAWQSQLFIHFIIADGVHQDWAYDKRGQLSMDLKRLDLFDESDNEQEKQAKFTSFLKQQVRLVKSIYYLKKYAIPTLVAMAALFIFMLW